jgi:hypothetical protein
MSKIGWAWQPPMSTKTPRDQSKRNEEEEDEEDDDEDDDDEDDEDEDEEEEDRDNDEDDQEREQIKDEDETHDKRKHGRQPQEQDRTQRRKSCSGNHRSTTTSRTMASVSTKAFNEPQERSDEHLSFNRGGPYDTPQERNRTRGGPLACKEATSPHCRRHRRSHFDHENVNPMPAHANATVLNHHHHHAPLSSSSTVSTSPLRRTSMFLSTGSSLSSSSVSLQTRLEHVWNQLRMPFSMRLNMLEKYAAAASHAHDEPESNDNSRKTIITDEDTDKRKPAAAGTLQEALVYWEDAVNVVLLREQCQVVPLTSTLVLFHPAPHHCSPPHFHYPPPPRRLRLSLF